VFEFYHSLPYGGHYGPQKTFKMVLDLCFYWPIIFKDARKCMKIVSNVIEQLDPLSIDMRCFNNPCYYVRYLIFRVLTLWVFSFLIDFLIFYLL